MKILIEYIDPDQLTFVTPLHDEISNTMYNEICHHNGDDNGLLITDAKLVNMNSKGRATNVRDIPGISVPCKLTKESIREIVIAYMNKLNINDISDKTIRSSECMVIEPDDPTVATAVCYLNSPANEEHERKNNLAIYLDKEEE